MILAYRGERSKAPSGASDASVCPTGLLWHPIEILPRKIEALAVHAPPFGGCLVSLAVVSELGLSLPFADHLAEIWACLDFHFTVENPQGISAKTFAAILRESLSGQPRGQIATLPTDLVYDVMLQMVKALAKKAMAEGVANEEVPVAS